MSDGDDLEQRVQLAGALRALYRSEAESAGFGPLAISRATAAAHVSSTRRRRTRALVVAAGVTVILATAGIVLPPLLSGPQPVPATPVPGSPEPTVPATPSPTRTPFTGGGTWSWVEREETPLTESTLSDTITIDGTDYFVTMPREGDGSSACRPVRLSRYSPDAGAWDEFPESPALPEGLCPFQSVAYGQNLYVTLYDGGPVTEIAGWHLGETNPLLVFQPATRTWTVSDPFPRRPRVFADERCVQLETGLFCVEATTEGAYTGEYELFDLAAGAWRQGSSAEMAAIPVSPLGDVPQRVTVDGRSLVVFMASPFASSASSGELTVSVVDPSSAKVVLQTSRQLPFAQIEALRDPQVVAPGILYGGPRTVHDPLDRATFLDLRTGRWWELEIPAASQYPADFHDSANYLDSAAWARRAYGAEVESFAVVRDYLYDPLAERWVLVPVVSVPPPDLDVPEGDEMREYIWYGSGPLECSYASRGPCYELNAGALTQVAQDLSYEQVMARSTTVR